MNLKNTTRRLLLNWASLVGDITTYTPSLYETPPILLSGRTSAWFGLELIIRDIQNRTRCGNKTCLEFGVEYGYSTVVFSNYFHEVIGVDIFTGDMHAGYNGDIYNEVKNSLSGIKNISLVKSDYRKYIDGSDGYFDLIHVDIIHTYEDTLLCGLWSANHSNCVLFHDTETFPDVKRAVLEIAKMTGKKFYNYPHCNGLGILY